MDTEQLRGRCQHCAGEYTFPNHGTGQSVACPHCSNAIILTPLVATPPPLPPSASPPPIPTSHTVLNAGDRINTQDSSTDTPAHKSKSVFKQVSVGMGVGLGVVVATIILIVVVKAFTKPERIIVSQNADGQAIEYSRSATDDYWRELNSIDKEGEALPHPNMDLLAQKQFDQVAADCNTYSQYMLNLTKRMRALPVSNVDPDALNLGLKWAETSDRVAAFSVNFGQFVMARKQYEETHTGFSVFFESFIRGALGDPLGKAKEMRSDEERIQMTADRLKEILQGLGDEARTWNTERARVRVVLTQRYGTEYK